jgi:hypothetical protein
MVRGIKQGRKKGNHGKQGLSVARMPKGKEPRRSALLLALALVCFSSDTTLHNFILLSFSPAANALFFFSFFLSSVCFP